MEENKMTKLFMNTELQKEGVPFEGKISEKQFNKIMQKVQEKQENGEVINAEEFNEMLWDFAEAMEKNAEKEAREYFNRKVTKQIGMIKRSFKTFSEARENILGTMFTIRNTVKNEQLNDYMEIVVDNFDSLFVGTIKQREEAEFYFKNVNKD